jgi:hypothetical protein
MFYCTYLGHTVDILKCSACRSYAIGLDADRGPSAVEDWVTYSFVCHDCGSSGSVRISSKVNLEAFETWEELENRIAELKVAMTLSALERPDEGRR